jgi:hypothetical protein
VRVAKPERESYTRILDLRTARCKSEHFWEIDYITELDDYKWHESDWTLNQYVQFVRFVPVSDLPYHLKI